MNENASRPVAVIIALIGSILLMLTAPAGGRKSR